MKKHDFVTLVMAVAGGLFFAIGMCMGLIAEWDAFVPGVVMGAVGVAVLIAMVIVRRKMQGKAAVKINRRSVGIAVLGIGGTLVLGVGMCCCLLWAERFFIPGIIVGVIGMAAVAMAYPVYNRVLITERRKVAPEILRLTEELMK